MIELVDNNNGPACQTFREARYETVGILTYAGDGLGMIETLVGTASHNDTGVARQGRPGDTVHDAWIPRARACEKIR